VICSSYDAATGAGEREEEMMDELGNHGMEWVAAHVQEEIL